MKKLSIIQNGVIATVLALAIIAGVPRLSLAQPAEPTMTTPNPDAKDQPPSKESGRLQLAAEPNEGGLDAATTVEIQRRFNELRSELLEGREKTVDWWLTATAIFLTLLGIVAVLAGYLTFRRFREIETEARENADETRRLLEQTQKDSAKVKSYSEGLTAESAGKDPDKAREAAENVQDNPKAPLIDRAIADAVLLQERGKIDEAIEKWRSIANVAEGTDNEIEAQAWFSIGYFLSEKADHEAELDAYTRAIRLNPNYAAAYNNRGLVKHALRQHEAALADYDAALRLNPNSVEAYNNRGLAKHALRQHEAALADYDAALRLNPNYAAAYNNRGNTKRTLGQPQAALADCDEALRLDPNSAAAYNNRGLAKHALRQHEAALADYDAALRLNPNYAAAYNNRGNTKRTLGQPQAALADCDEALRLDPDSAEAYNNRGNAKLLLGRHEAALADYDAALRLDPNYAAAYNNRGNAKLLLGQHQAALADYDAGLRLTPNFAEAYNNRGRVKLELDQMDEARQDFEKALALAQKAGDEDTATKAKSSLQALDKPKDS